MSLHQGKTENLNVIAFYPIKDLKNIFKIVLLSCGIVLAISVSIYVLDINDYFQTGISVEGIYYA